MSLMSQRTETIEELYQWRFGRDRAHYDEWLKKQAFEDALDRISELKHELARAKDSEGAP